MAGKHPEDKVDEIQKVVMYSRIGYSVSKEADEQRFLLQEGAMLKFAADNHLEVKSTHREVAPGTLDRWSRPVLDEAIKSLKWSKKEKSVLLVTRIDRLAKSFWPVVKLLDDYNPNFLAVSSGMRYDQFVFQIQVASAEEEFRFKYGKVYNTSDGGYKKFARCHRLGIECMVKAGHSYEGIAEMYESLRMPLPWDWIWSEETICKIMELSGG